MTEATPGADDTADRIIERTDHAPPVYFSRQVGRDIGSPVGGWTPERAKATRLTKAEAKALLAEDGPLGQFATNAKAVQR